MSHEIIYTSAPRGLKAGARGFCTVAATSGMSQPLADRLESLSGYRHAFAAHDPQARLNPVNYSHVVITVGGRKHHVLSRVADAGLDYTQRSNKFAHHVALEVHELTSAGPAWTMQQPDFFETSFSGEPRLLGAGRRPGSGEARPAVCMHWQKTIGDAGWGGVLAETVLAQPQKPVYLIFQPGQDLLPLVAEALALVPPERRWQATYSTYFTRLPPGIECQWRFLLAESDEATAVSRQPHALVIDLRGPLPPAQGGPLVEAARSGKLPAERPAVLTGAVPPPLAAAEPPQGAADAPVGARDGYRLSPPSRRRRCDDRGIDLSRPPRKRTKGKVVVGAIAGGILTLLAISAVVTKFVVDQRRQRAVASMATSKQKDASTTEMREKEQNRTSPNPPRKAARSKDSKAPSGEQESPAPETQPRTTSATSDDAHAPAMPLPGPSTTSTSPDDAAGGKEATSNDTSQKKEPQTAEPFASLPDCLQLPATTIRNSEKTELAALKLDGGPELILELIGWKELLGEYNNVTMPREPEIVGGARRWVIKHKMTTNISRLEDVGEFWLRDGSLSFKWTCSASSPKYWLRNCLLRLQHGKAEAVRRLRKVKEIEADAMTVDLSQSPSDFDLSEVLAPGDDAIADCLSVIASLEGENGARLGKETQGKINDDPTLRIQFNEIPAVEIEIGVAYSPSARLQLCAFSEIPDFRDKRFDRKKRELFSIALLNEWRDKASEQLEKLNRAPKNKSGLNQLSQGSPPQENPQTQPEAGRQKTDPGDAKQGVAKDSTKTAAQNGAPAANLSEKQRKVVEELQKSLNDCERRRSRLEGFKATMRFQLYYQVGEHRVVIAETLPAKDIAKP